MKRNLAISSIIIFAGLLLGAGIQAWLGVGDFLAGWLGSSLLLAVCGLALFAAWRLAGGGRALAWMILLAFALRLGFGVVMIMTLPAAGYPEKEQQAGYLSKDAFTRDNQAWGLGSSKESLTAAFSSKSFFSDQYGGMLAFSALVYRGLSPDAHRAYLILILAAGAAALGIPFFYAAVRRRWGVTAAAVGAWILALYPEAIFWGASQMREPFLITLIALGLWGAVTLRRKPALGLAALAICLAGMLPLSVNVALASAGVLAMWVWLDYLPGQDKPLWRVVGWITMGLGALALAGATLAWLISSSQFDILTAEANSGWVQLYVRRLGDQWQIPIVTVYGLMRPLLPAAVIEPSLPLWGGIFTGRALGWYLLLPVLLYGLIVVWRAPEMKDRRQLVWAGLVVVIWTLISSFRGGGDTSDNPRYRVIFLVWMALLAGWAWAWARAHGFRWLLRWGAVTVLFLLGFTLIYLSRYYHLLPQIDLLRMFGLVGLLSGAVMAGGWWLDRRSVQKVDLHSPETRP